MPQAILEPTCTSQIHPTAGEGRIGMTDGITLADQDVVSLDKIADGLIGLRILLVNVYAVSNGSDWVVVDAGLYLSAGRIRRWAQAHFGDRKPAAIVLTHGHFDHVGALKDLLEEWDVPVFAHEPEMPYLQGRLSYPAPRAAAGGGLMSVLAPFYPRGPIDLGNRVQTLPADGAVPALPGWRWVHTPGHTAGHVSLFRDSDQTLVVGDAFCTTKQESALAIATQKPELHGPPAYYTSDWDAAKRSVELLANLRPRVVAPGHGLPMAGVDVADALQTLARDFDQVARPHSEDRAA
jgi:glyoxylase-like metal-dependent hydrolase (beta-lactamase superfamily II)